MTWLRILELAVGLVLLSGAVAKLSRPASFASAIRGHRLVPNEYATISAVCLVALEVVVGGLLLSGLANSVALVGGALMFAAFGAVSWHEVKETPKGHVAADCGCLGGGLKLRHTAGAAVLNLGVSLACLVGAGTAVAGGYRAGDVSVGDGLGLAAFAALLAALYWIAHYALSVVGDVEAKAQEQREAS